MTSMADKVSTFMTAAKITFGDDTDFLFTPSELNEIREDQNCSIPGAVWKNSIDIKLRKLPAPDRGRRLYDLNLALSNAGSASNPNTLKVVTFKQPEIPQTSVPSAVVEVKAALRVSMTQLADNDELNPSDYTPSINPNYIPWGHFAKVAKVVLSGRFFPIMVTGSKGNGKTEMIEQACAKSKRAFVRVNFTSETDESKLIGGINLIDGNTVWTDGLVLKAMKMGAVLLLDEVDLGGEKIMCLQSILEGKPYVNKKTSEVIYPAPGFTIITTQNTKGRGNVTGQYQGAKVMNAAFLDRIKVTFVQPNPSAQIEKRILTKVAERLTDNNLAEDDGKFIEALTFWAESIRKAHANETLEDDVSTRRLISIVDSYYMFDRDIDFAISAAIQGFEEDEISSMMSLWRASYGIESDITNNSPGGLDAIITVPLTIQVAVPAA